MILSRVKITNNKKLITYRKIISPSLFKQIKQRAKSLVGLRVLHLNATNQGGGVAEILQNLVPLMNDLKLDARWYTIKPINPKFFTITKKIHNALQGEKLI